jgi:hypothetical protein
MQCTPIGTIETVMAQCFHFRNFRFNIKHAMMCFVIYTISLTYIYIETQINPKIKNKKGLGGYFALFTAI